MYDADSDRDPLRRPGRDAQEQRDRRYSGDDEATVKHVTVIKVTPEQVRAAKIECAAFRSAGLEPDPLVVLLAQATVRDRDDEQTRRAQPDDGDDGPATGSIR
jgi:hypothetical protein